MLPLWIKVGIWLFGPPKGTDGQHYSLCPEEDVFAVFAGTKLAALVDLPWIETPRSPRRRFLRAAANHILGTGRFHVVPVRDFGDQCRPSCAFAISADSTRACTIAALYERVHVGMPLAELHRGVGRALGYAEHAIEGFIRRQRASMGKRRQRTPVLRRRRRRPCRSSVMRDRRANPWTTFANSPMATAWSQPPVNCSGD